MYLLLACSITPGNNEIQFTPLVKPGGKELSDPPPEAALSTVFHVVIGSYFEEL